jgi:hypothetical protein
MDWPLGSKSWTYTTSTCVLVATFHMALNTLRSLLPRNSRSGIPVRVVWQRDSFAWSRVQLKCDSTRWRTGGEVKGKLANGVGTLHTTSEHGVSSITTITTDDAHTSAASSRLNWLPRRFKWTRLFRRKTKSGFCACAITFQTQFNKHLQRW